MGNEGGFLAVFVPVPEAADAVAFEVALQPVNQRQIAVATHRRKADQTVQKLTRRKVFHRAPHMLWPKVPLATIPVNTGKMPLNSIKMTKGQSGMTHKFRIDRLNEIVKTS